MKVLLIDPPGSVIGLNSGLGYLGGALSKAGIGLKVLDFNNNKNDIEHRLECALRDGPAIVGFSIKTNTVASAIEIAGLCKSLSPKTPIAAGGPGISILGGAFLKENHAFDFAFTGEAEKSLIQFIKVFTANPDGFTKIPGLVFRNGNKVVANSPEVTVDLDSIILPDYSAFEELNLVRNAYPLVTSRGCPYNCSYCNVSLVSGKRFRARSPENVILELKEAKRVYGVKNFQVYDDTFTQDVKRAKKICELMISENLDLKWVCQNGIRADRLDSELLFLMKEAGCEGVWFGVESMDDEVFKAVDKGEDVDDIVRAIGLTHEAGIPVSAFFIIGLPGSTYEKDMETLRKAKRLKLNLTTWSLATPYPHTAMWDWVQKNGKMLRNYRDVSFFVEPRCVFETDEYGEAQRLKVLYKANLAFSRYECLSADNSSVKKILKILNIAMKYDPFRLPLHLLAGTFLFAKKMMGIKRR